MHATAPLVDRVLDRTIEKAERLPLPDLRAAEALVAAMAAWNASDLAAYRSSVLDELAALRGQPPRGFLAVELAALAAIGAAA